MGFIGGYFIANRNKMKTFSNETERIKSENIAKLKDYIIKQTDKKINNEKIRKHLNISDSTACRYLDDLEKEGLITQIGSDGPKVYYKIN